MRQKIILIFCLAMLLSTLISPSCATAADKENAGVDIAIIVDTSGSMKDTDPNRIAIEAAKLFIDMTEMGNARIALVTFSDELGTVTKLTELNGITDKANLKSSINPTPYKGDTDMGLALKKGYDLLMDDSGSKNQKAILFFTDGNIDLGGSTKRTDEDSLQDTKDVIAEASKNGVPIYTIGLNSDGSVDKNLLSEISEKTEGRNYIVDSADILPDIFNEIFADFINSNIISLGDYVTDGKNYTDIPFQISNNSVLEANIILLSKEKLKEFELTNPGGDSVRINSDKLILSESNQYTLLKLVTPEKGDWLLRIKGKKDCKVHINLIFNYNVELKCKAEYIAGGNNSYIQVDSWMEKDGEKLEDEALYAGFEGEVHCKSQDGEETYPITVEGAAFSAKIPVDKAEGEYEIFTSVTSDAMYRVSDTAVVSITNTNSAPVFHNLPSNVKLGGLVGSGEKEDVKLSDYVTDSEGDEITYSAVVKSGGSKVASVTVNKDLMTIKGGERGSAQIEITATDSKGAAATSSLIVDVNSKFASFWPLVLIVIGILLLLILAGILLLWLRKISKERNRVLYGSIRWLITGDRNREQVYQLGYDKGSVPLSKMILEPSLNELGLSKVTIHMTNTLDGIEIKNNSKTCTMVKEFGGTLQDKAVIGSGEFVTLSGKYMGNDIAVKVTYSLY